MEILNSKLNKTELRMGKTAKKNDAAKCAEQRKSYSENTDEIDEILFNFSGEFAEEK